MSAVYILDLLAKYSTQLKQERKLTVVPPYSYNSAGAVSGGWKDLRSGVSAFAGVESPSLAVLNPPDMKGEFVVAPLVRSALAVGYNVDSCSSDQLSLSMDNLANIFYSRITWWNDSRLVTDAPCLSQATGKIKALHRTTPSGATYMFTKILHMYNSTLWPLEPTMNWPTADAGGETQSIPGNDFMLYSIRITPNSIGYLPWSNKDPYYTITYASIKSSFGNIAMTASTVRGAASFLEAAGEDNIPLCSNCWPILATSYIAIRKNTVISSSSQYNATLATSCLNMRESALFLRYALDQQVLLQEYAPLSPTLKKQAIDTLGSLTCNKKSVLGTDFGAAVRWNVARRSLLAGMGTMAAIICVGLLIFGYNESLYAKDLRVLAAMAGDDGLGMGPNSSLLEALRIPDDDELVIPLDDDPPRRRRTASFSIPTNDDQELAIPGDEEDDSTQVQLSQVPIAESSAAPSPKKFSSQVSFGPSGSGVSKSMIAISDVTIGRIIGSGSYGDVFRGRYQAKPVAIKRIAVTQDATLVASFLKEVRAMTSLDHPHILRLIGIAVQSPYTYIISEYCKNGSLDTYVHKHQGQVTVLQKLDWMRQVAEGMSYLHSMKITHRDLKLNNILLTSDLQVKVGDLGTASTTHQTHRTRVGTLDHCAPEILDGRSYTQSVDVYSFAICLWSLFSGMPLYPGYTMYDIITRVTGGQRPSMDFITSPRLATLIQACWNQEPTARPTFSEIQEALKDLGDKDFQTFTM
jgi:ABC-type phosphate transport system substrate-binding protein